MTNNILSMHNLSSKEGHVVWLVAEVLHGELHLNQETALGLHYLTTLLQGAFGMDAEGFATTCETELEHYEPVAVQLERLAALIREAVSYAPEHRRALRLRLSEGLNWPGNGRAHWPHDFLA